MIVPPFGSGTQRRDPAGHKSSGTGHILPPEALHGGGVVPLATPAGGTAGPPSANAIYQHIHDLSAKRISTFNYLRRVHDGRVYWFNTVHYSKADLIRMPSLDPRKLSRRAINYLLLGLSLPLILDPNSTPFEYLRALNALLLEFETFQQAHPPDGSSSSTLARARIPHMFRRATHAGNKTRRTSSAAEIGLPMQSSDPSDLKAMSGSSAPMTAASAVTSYPIMDSSDLLPGEEYSYLLTPQLPFDPDFFETFATLCDVFIDCYSRLVALVPSPAVCTGALGEIFSKTDAKIRKIIVAGIVREFEEASRNNARNEVAGINRVVMGGLLG